MIRILILLCGLSCAFPLAAHAQPSAAAVASGSSSTAACDQALSGVEACLAELERERDRHPILGPNLLMIGGFLTGGALSFAAFIDAVNADGVHDADPDVSKRRVRILAGTSLIGWAAGFSGLVWLSARLRPRRALLPERHRLLEQRQKLRRGECDLTLGARGPLLVLEARF